MRGSDASWKDNIEAPPEFQDFSDDEEETRYKNKVSRVTDSPSPESQFSFQGPRKRAFNSEGRAIEKESHRPTFKNFGVFSRGKFNNQGSRFSSPDYPGSGCIVNPVAAKNISHRAPMLAFPHNVPYPCNTVVNTPQGFFPPRFSGSPSPYFESPPRVHSNQNFCQPFNQQRMLFHPETSGAPWYRPMIGSHFFPPPPPPPPPLPSTTHIFPHSDVGERTDG